MRRLVLCQAAVVGLVCIAAGPASAATVSSSAFGISAQNVAGLLNIPQTPQSTCPAGSNESAIPVDLGALGGVGVLNASTQCDASVGTSSADGGAADVALLGTALARSITADAVSAHCAASGTDTPTGSTTVANLFILGVRVDIPVGSSTPQTVSIPGVASVVINEQTLSNGALTVNALHITLLGGNLGDIIIGSATCGPNAAVLPVSAFSFQDLPLILGALALLVAIGFGIRSGARRLRTAA
jgi:hypothetical protein